MTHSKNTVVYSASQTLLLISSLHLSELYSSPFLRRGDGVMDGVMEGGWMEGHA